MARVETYEPAFTSSSGTDLAGIPVAQLDLPSPHISYNLPFDQACAKHVKQTYNALCAFVTAAGSLNRNTNRLDPLVNAVGKGNIASIRKGMAPHSLWSEMLSITNEARSQVADCIIILSAGRAQVEEMLQAVQ